MKTIVILYLLAGGGVLNTAWGGPSLMRFETSEECEAVAKSLRAQPYVLETRCLVLTLIEGKVPQ